VIEVVLGDITRMDVDAIVNAANERMLGGGGVDGAIHRAAGRELYEACLALPEVRPGVRCPTGESRITPGFKLAARHVIHTAGPVWRGGAQGEPALLASCYRSALTLARDHGVRSIAFPAISCGVYGYPLGEAAAIALQETRARETDFDRILLVALDRDVHTSLSHAYHH
jgi:O-acetyl-ADP-ribose deacetylase